MTSYTNAIRRQDDSRCCLLLRHYLWRKSNGVLLGAIQCKKEKVISFLMTSLFARTYFACPLPPVRFRLSASARPLPPICFRLSASARPLPPVRFRFRP